jgi:tRNA pseudouridine32 synthase/23S rRNA pseudouridine746 synthase
LRRGPHKADSLLARLRARWPRVGAAHRLDRDTSGLVVFAKTKPALRALSAAFQSRRVHKVYVGAVAGAPGAAAGTLDAPIGKVWDGAAGFHRVQLVDEAAGGRPSRTDWAVLAAGPESTLLELTPVTGRPQQLRVHLAGAGWPLLGDALHGGAPAPRLCLHAHRLSFAHPATGESSAFSSPTPFDAAGRAILT